MNVQYFHVVLYYRLVQASGKNTLAVKWYIRLVEALSSDQMSIYMYFHLV